MYEVQISFRKNITDLNELNVIFNRTMVIPMIKYLFVLSLFLLGSINLSAAEKPNVIIILTDDQGYGDLSCHGNPVLKTPKLDDLYRESIRFTDFHVAPMCTPTRGELLTGLNAFHNGATAVCEGRSLPRRELKLMPQYFKENGYVTGHFGKWHLGDAYPFRPHDRGFDESIHNRAWGIGSLAEHWQNNAFDDQYWHKNKLKQYEGYNTDVFFQQAMNWIEKQEKPFFVYLPTTAAHSPFVVAEKYAEPYSAQRANANFYGMIANIDENIAGLDQFLVDKGLKENTIFIFMTDNGTVKGHTVYNAGMRGHKTSEYDGGHRVPFFLRWPVAGLNQGRDINALTHSTDLLPTLIDLCGLRIPNEASFDGHSLRPLIEGNDTALDDRIVVIQYRAEFVKWRGAILWKKWRLVNGKELHDVTKDPGQENNLYDQHPDVVQQMREHYEQWVKQTSPLMNQPNFVSIGTPHEATTWLSSCNWTGSYADNWGNLRSQNTPGLWYLQVEKTGEYRVSMYLFHPDANTPLGGQINRVPVRPVTQVRLLLDGEAIETKATMPKDTHATFELSLKQGQKVTLQGNFLDKESKVLCGAFYTFVQKIDAQGNTADIRKFVSVPGAKPKLVAEQAKSSPSVITRDMINRDVLPQDTLLIADFESKDFGNWKTEGTAFRTGPTGPKNRVTGFLGKQLVDTFLANESDQPTGKLISPPFEIKRNHINFLIGGGRTAEKTCVNLLIDGKPVLTAVGSTRKNKQNRKVMNWASWDVSPWKGKQAQIEIVDQLSKGWGHIMVDHVFQSNQAMKKTK